MTLFHHFNIHKDTIWGFSFNSPIFLLLFY